MTLAILILIFAPFAATISIAIAVDERYGLTDRIATTRPGRWARTLINQHIDP